MSQNQLEIELNHEEDNQYNRIISVADFDGNGQVEISDVQNIISRYFSGDYHPLYDLDTNGHLDIDDILLSFLDIGKEVPVLDQQIAQVTQATMKYYGPEGIEQAISDGYLPFTPEAEGHGRHYYNPTLAQEIGNQEELDILRPLGLNYDLAGNLVAVFYARLPRLQEADPNNPLAELSVDPDDDFPPQESFDGLTEEDWHFHENVWITNVGNLDSEAVYFEEDVPIDLIISRLEAANFELFPDSDQFYVPKFWMLHGWFHSFNENGNFAITNPDIGLYAPAELGPHHSMNHEEEEADLILGTDDSEEVVGTEANDFINSFGGDDLVIGQAGDDLIWGGSGEDSLWGDQGESSNSSEAGKDMIYGGPGDDLIQGQRGDDRLFGSTGDDVIEGGSGDDLLRGDLGDDILKGQRGQDLFVLIPNQGTDKIRDFEVDQDFLVLEGGLTVEDLLITQRRQSTLIQFGEEVLATLKGVNAEELIEVQPFL